jgi:N-methylhydantoinase B
MSGDIELLEHAYPILIHRYSLMADSGGAGEFRGGSGTRLEIEPLDHAMTVVGFGEGRQLPTAGAAGARNALLEPKLGRLIHRQADGSEDHYTQNPMLTLQPGERIININPGGGGYGDPLRRPVAASGGRAQRPGLATRRSPGIRRGPRCRWPGRRNRHPPARAPR